MSNLNYLEWVSENVTTREAIASKNILTPHSESILLDSSRITPYSSIIAYTINDSIIYTINDFKFKVVQAFYSSNMNHHKPGSFPDFKQSLISCFLHLTTEECILTFGYLRGTWEPGSQEILADRSETPSFCHYYCPIYWYIRRSQEVKILYYPCTYSSPGPKCLKWGRVKLAVHLC